MSAPNRKQRLGSVLITVGLLLAALVSPADATERNALFDADGKIKLRILCTTSVKPGRTDDFVAFLSKHFVKVGTTDYKSFQEGAAEGSDVVCPRDRHDGCARLGGRPQARSQDGLLVKLHVQCGSW